MGTICHCQKKKIVRDKAVSTQITPTPVMYRVQQEQIEDDGIRPLKIIFTSTYNNVELKSDRRKPYSSKKPQIKDEMLFGRKSKHGIYISTQI